MENLTEYIRVERFIPDAAGHIYAIHHVRVGSPYVTLLAEARTRNGADREGRRWAKRKGYLPILSLGHWVSPWDR